MKSLRTQIKGYTKRRAKTPTLGGSAFKNINSPKLSDYKALGPATLADDGPLTLDKLGVPRKPRTKNIP